MNRLLTKEKSIIQTTQLDKFIEYMEYPTMIFDEDGELLHCNQTAKDQSCNQIGSKSISLIRDTPDDDYIYSSCLLNGTQHDLAINKLHFDDITLFMITIGPTYAKGNEAQTVDELQKIIDSVHDGIYISDNRGFTLQINKRYSEMTGINRHEVIGRHISELIHRGYFDSSITVKVLEKRQTVSILQRTKDSNQMWLVTGNPIFNQNGCLLKVLNTVYDMTELNQVKESLRAQEIANNTQRAELEVLRSQVVNVPDLIGNSRLTNNIKIQIKKVSNFDSTVLILGETGSGKNVVARAIHKLSPRSSNPFIEVNCGSLPEQLIESELFGYSSGAFTGAMRGGKPGLLEVAHNGTIFLDEIGEMPYQVQVKLLTFLQDRKIRRVGETTSREVNVRVIAATNKDLKQLVTEKKFREDLYYRLSVVPIQIPPIRERKEDIYALTDYFLVKYNQKYNRSVKLSKAVYLVFENYQWPGNVREIQHVVEQLVVLADSDTINPQDLPVNFRSESLFKKTGSKNLNEIIKNVESEIIKEAWKQLGDINMVADQLGIHRTTLVRKINKLGLILK